jgi:hypothetical protein
VGFYFYSDLFSKVLWANKERLKAKGIRRKAHTALFCIFFALFAMPFACPESG